MWAAYRDYDTGAAILAPCGTDVAESDLITVDSMKPDASILQFSVWKDRFVLLTGQTLLLVDASSGQTEITMTLENVTSFCVDENGALYALSYVQDGQHNSHRLTKYDLETQKEVWNRSELPLMEPNRLSCTTGGGLFLSRYSTKVFCIDPETGATQELIDLSYDLDEAPPTMLQALGTGSAGCQLAVDSQYRVFFCVFNYWALFCSANLPSLGALYAISVRQASVLPIGRPSNSQYPAFFRFHLTMDTLAFGYSFPLPGGFRTFTL